MFPYILKGRSLATPTVHLSVFHGIVEFPVVLSNYETDEAGKEENYKIRKRVQEFAREIREQKKRYGR